MQQPSRHQCLIYEGSPLQQLPSLAAAIQQKLHENYRCLYLNSPAMVEAIRARLSASGINVADEIAKGRLILSSEPPTAPGGIFDDDLMIRNLEELADHALRDGYKGIFATGDMTWEFGNEESFTRLLQYEWKLERLLRRRQELCGICQYHQDTLPREVTRQGLLSHSTLFINKALSIVNQHYGQSEDVAEEESKNTDLDKAVEDVCQMQGAT